jgi:hypothetical protein
MQNPYTIIRQVKQFSPESGAAVGLAELADGVVVVSLGSDAAV